MTRIPSAAPPVIAPIQSVWDQNGSGQQTPSPPPADTEGTGDRNGVDHEILEDKVKDDTAEQVIKVRTKKVLVDFSDAEKTRLQNTVRYTMGFEGHTSQVEFIRVAVERYCSDLEATHNNGEPWPSPGETRRG